MFITIYWSLVAAGLYAFVIHPCFFSPLAKIPKAHPLSPFTNLWIKWIRYVGKETLTVHQAFKEKGPVLRLGPNDIVFNIIDEGVKTVYGGSFEKLDWYSFWTNYGSALSS